MRRRTALFFIPAFIAYIQLMLWFAPCISLKEGIITNHMNLFIRYGRSMYVNIIMILLLIIMMVFCIANKGRKGVVLGFLFTTGVNIWYSYCVLHAADAVSQIINENGLDESGSISIAATDMITKMIIICVVSVLVSFARMIVLKRKRY